MVNGRSSHDTTSLTLPNRLWIRFQHFRSSPSFIPIGLPIIHCSIAKICSLYPTCARRALDKPQYQYSLTSSRIDNSTNRHHSEKIPRISLPHPHRRLFHARNNTCGGELALGKAVVVAERKHKIQGNHWNGTAAGKRGQRGEEEADNPDEFGA